MANYANEFRPVSFADVLGHERYVRAFRNMIRNGTLPNCILLAGNAGLGKTTLARVIAAAAMCKDVDRETSDPCGKCADCKSSQGINDGVNFMHLDGAGSKLKDVVEGELKHFLHSNPIGGARAKVCVADEAQALSDGAKNALLTLTENLPKSSVFIMTTMDPEAIDFAIRSRSFKIHLNSLPMDKLIDGVKKNRPALADKDEPLELLALAAKGCMREMWQLIQQLESYEEDITPDLAAWMTKSSKAEDRKVIWEAVRKRNFKGITTGWDELIGKGATHDRLGEQLLEDLINMSAKDPYARDWAPAIRYLSQAQVMGLPTAWKAALCSIVDDKSQQEVKPLVEAPSAVQDINLYKDLADSKALYKMLFEREPK